MHIQPDCHICRSGTTIKMRCLRALSINTDLYSKNNLQPKKTKNNYYMISKTNGLIDYMNKQHKERVTYDLPSGNLISFFPSGP